MESIYTLYVCYRHSLNVMFVQYFCVLVFSLACHTKCEIFPLWHHADAQSWVLSFGLEVVCLLMLVVRVAMAKHVA